MRAQRYLVEQRRRRRERRLEAAERWFMRALPILLILDVIYLLNLLGLL